MAALVSNKKAHFNYSIKSTIVAGIELLGHEVKSLRSSQGSLDGSRVIIRGGEAYLVGAFIPSYQTSNTTISYDERRNRRLLLKKSEIRELGDIESKKGFAIIPISIFNQGKKIKVEVAIAEGKKKFDKRETIKKRDVERDIRRKMK